MALKEVALAPDGVAQTESLFFHAGAAGVKRIVFSLTALPVEESAANNAMDRLVTVSGDKRRILYVEGEPRWDHKFLRRAAEGGHALQVVSMLRTTDDKIYRQRIANPSEHADGLPVKVEDLFGYDRIVIGSVEAGYFTPAQQELLRAFVDRRGGGTLFLGGRFALSDGGWDGVERIGVDAYVSCQCEEKLSSRLGDGAANTGGCRRLGASSDRRPCEKRCPVEKAALHDGLPGCGYAQAGGDGAGTECNRPWDASSSGDAARWARADGGAANLRDVALADEPGAWGSDV